MSKPTYRAYVVDDAPEGSDRKARWIEGVAVWPLQERQRLDLVVPLEMSVSGRIVCVQPTDESDDS